MFALLFSVDGRIARSTYLCIGVGTRAAAVAMAALSETGWLPKGIGFLSVLAFFAFAWISFAAAVKRLHDQDRRGWWLLLEIPVAWLIYGLCAAVFYRYDTSGMLAFLASSLLLGRHRGTPGINRFGPQPGSLWQRIHGQDRRRLHGAFYRSEPIQAPAPAPVPQTASPTAPVTRGPIRTRPRRRVWSPQPLIIVIAMTAAFVVMAKVQMTLQNTSPITERLRLVDIR